MLGIKENHEKILYPTCRVRSEKAGGSGTIIYSKLDSKNPAEYLSFILTNHHVVEDAIKIKDDWDSVVKKNIKKEFTSPVGVEIFRYVYLSKVDSSDSRRAEIIAYDKYHDLAVLKLDSPLKQEYVASLIPEDKIKDLKLFTPIWSVGASLLHDPFANPGYITYLKEIIENKMYGMSNCNSIFGNSGGGIYLADTGEFIGVPSRISAIQVGFGVDIITWMGFFAAPQRIYEFLKEQDLGFIYDDKENYYDCMKKRKEKQKRSLIESFSENREDKEGVV